MLSSLSLPILILIFIGAAAAVWIAGIRLSNTTDVLSSHFGLGEALGGLIILEQNKFGPRFRALQAEV